MSNKSYTLADGSTVTVTATEQGIPFNEGMQALTKAIKAKITASSGGGAGGSTPTVTLNVDDSKMDFYEGDYSKQTFEGGVRFKFGEKASIYVTYELS